MRIQLNIQTGTTATPNIGEYTFAISGLTGLIDKSSIKTISRLRGTTRVFLVAPPIVNYMITENSGIYTIDLTGIMTDVFQSGDIVECVVEVVDKQDTIIESLENISVDIESISNPIYFSSNITVNYGNIIRYVVQNEGIINVIENVTVTGITKNGTTVSIPFPVSIGDVILITCINSAPFTALIKNLVSSKQVNSSQNYSVAESRYIYGVTLLQKSNYLNTSLIFAAIATTTAIYNAQYSVEKVDAVALGTYNNVFPFTCDRSVDYTNATYFLSTNGVYKYRYDTKTVSIIYSISIPNNIIMVSYSGGNKIYVSCSNGVIMINPTTDICTVIDSVSCRSVHYNNENEYVYACPATGFILKAINKETDVVIVTMTMLNNGAYNLSHSAIKPNVNKIFFSSHAQTGGNNIYCIDTSANTYTGNYTYGNIICNGIIYSSISDKIYMFDATNYRLVLFNPNTLTYDLTYYSLPTGPYGFLIKGNYLYISCYGSATVVVYNLTNHTLAQTIIVSNNPHKIFYDEYRDIIVVVSQSTHTINEIIPL